MMPLPLPAQTLTWLTHAKQAGQRDAQVLLHLIARADARDRDVALIVDSYSKTIAALCRRLEALERRPSAQPATPVEDGPMVDDGPVVAALIQAESTMADIAEGKAVSPRADECLQWAEARCTEALAAIRPVMRQHGIRTSELAPAAPAPAAPDPVEPEIEVCETCNGEGTIDERLGGISTSNPAATCPDCDGVGEPRRFHRQPPAGSVALAADPAERLVERVIFAMDRSASFGNGNAYAAIREVADWLDTQGHQSGANAVRCELWK